MRPPSSPAARIKALDGIRGGAALCVAIMHYQGLFASQPFLDFAYVAVDLFFALSGIVIAMTYESRIIDGMRFREFLGNRFARLYPLFLLTTAIGLAHALALWAAGKVAGGREAGVGAAASTIPNFFMLPSLSATGDQALFPFNGPSWSVFAELGINLVFFFWIRARRPGLLPIVLLAASGLVFMVMHRGNIDAGWGGAHLVLGLTRAASGFFIGVALYHHRAFVADTLRRLPVEIVIVAILAYPLLQLEHAWRDLLVALVLVPVCIGAALESSSWLLENRVAQWLGTISYSLYLWQTPYSLWFASAARQGFQVDMTAHNPWLGTVWLAGLLMVATFSFYYIETPSQRSIKGLIHGKREEARNVA